MTVIFPHANHHQVPYQIFLAAWFEWFRLYGPAGADPLRDAMPRLNRAVGFDALVAKVPRFSLDVMCRMLVPTPYRNTMHATNPFMDDNHAFLERVQVRNPAGGRMVNGARLTNQASDLLNGLLGAGGNQLLESYQSEVDKIVEADQDFVSSSGEEISPMILGTVTLTDQPDLMSPAVFQCTGPVTNISNVIDWFIDLIDEEPWQPYYRGRPVAGSRPVTGWGSRLQGYFWPNPSSGIAQTVAGLAGITGALPDVVNAIMNAAPPQQPPAAILNNAEAIADQIFRWGGVPQVFTAQNIIDVVRSAVTRIAVPGAPMNSGWTKLAAFATAHLPGQEQVIWDSRVANSVIRRLDYILDAAGCNSIPTYLTAIGTVPGRGGSRPGMSKTLKLKWPNGYQKWSSQLAASSFVRAVVARINARSIPLPPGLPKGLWPDGTTPDIWNMRMVEMVLFMDGY